MHPLPLLLAALAAAALVACARREPSPEPVRAVRVMTVASGRTAHPIEYAAEVRARVESRPGFRVPGKMLSRSVEPGQQVRAGQPLARLDATDLRLSQEAAGAAARAAKTQLDLAAAEYRRFQDLQAQGFISASELERREAQLKATRAAAQQARAQADAQANQAGYAVLTAPASGVVLTVEAEPGAVLGAGAPVVRIALDGPRDAVFAVPENAVGATRALLGRRDAIRVRAWGAPESIAATVREVAAAADPVTRTFKVKADLGTAMLPLGRTLTVTIDQAPQTGITRLPLTAVMQQRGQTAVWVLDPQSMTVNVQPISVAGADGNEVIASAGLHAGQLVVTAGVHTLNPGQTVKLYRETASEAEADRVAPLPTDLAAPTAPPAGAAPLISARR